MGRLVEAVHAFDFGDDVRVETLCAAVTAAAGNLAAAAGNPAGGAAFKAFKVGDHLFDRPAGGGLNDQKIDQQDAEQGGDDQQQTTNDIGQHAYSAPAGWSPCCCPAPSSCCLPNAPRRRASLSGSTHQVNSPRSYFGGVAGWPNLFQ